MFKIECLLSAENHLGEGPIWDEQSQALFWVDGTGNRVGNPSIWKMDYASQKVDKWYLEKDIGAMTIRENSNAVLALSDGFYFFDFLDGLLEPIALVDENNPRIRLNDGKTDRRGRFIVGGMDDKEELDICSLWRLDPDLSVTRLDTNIICSNGPSGLQTTQFSTLRTLLRRPSRPTPTISIPEHLVIKKSLRLQRRKKVFTMERQWIPKGIYGQQWS